MIVELMREISNRGWMELKMHGPKDTLAGASYIQGQDVIASGISGQGARFP